MDIKSLPNNTTFSSVPEGADAIVLSDLAKSTTHGILYIVRDDKRMVQLADDLAYFAPDIKVIVLPAWDCLPYDRVSPSQYISNKRTESLCEIAHGIHKNTIVVTTVNSALQRIPTSETLRNISFKAKVGDEVDREELIRYLVKCGYIRSATANEAGEFAVRGSIIDIFASGSENGYRIDFFGNRIDAIRLFDPLTQISGKKQKNIALIPVSEVVLDEASILNFRNKYRQLFGNVAGNDPLYDAISEGRQYAGMEHWLPLFYNRLETIFEYVPKAVICMDHLANEAKSERYELINDYYNARTHIKDLGFSGGDSYRPIEPALLYLKPEEFDADLAISKVLNFNPFDLPESLVGHSPLPNPPPHTGEGNKKMVKSLGYKTIPDFSVESKTSKESAFDLCYKFLQAEKLASSKSHKAGLKVVIACFSEGARDRMKNILSESDIHTIMMEGWDDIKDVKGKSIGLTVLRLEKGFRFENIIIISEQDLLGERLNRTKASKKRSDKFLAEASSLSEGELVVHKEHGLGRFEALEILTISGKNHDCLRVIYHGGDKLYIPVENIETLSRYGSDDENIKLDKLGGASWQARKARLKKRIKDIADDLLKVAAKRALKKSYHLTPMEGVYEEFCARFPYMETDDQLRCIQDVASDLDSGRPMDRLICGDVGFGKTEVALRAAFIAASSSDHKQVAIIAPTTLLVRQHYRSFKERFAGFPFEVRGLSRLTSPKEAKEVKQGLKDGKVDIVIGTHALLAKSIEFKNLGLVIVDEEQQFGVTQKERFKQMRSDVHMLALSATPIPRTLQMSLTGIKDLSLIATPPVDRLAIRSFTMPFDPIVIRNAILREHYRGGKTFFVVPRIKDLDEVQEKLTKLIPEVKFARAHGQLSPTELDNTMNNFYEGKADVLLSTNIIGSGIDLPTANTIIIYKADMFGLAQLYQMRGRVGRGKTRAYAYFTIPSKKIPSKTALKRLEVIQHLDSLGAGFNLASHDMDIRGFGNLIGDEQSGQVKEVGIELYQEMLREAIENAKAEESGKEPEDEHFSPTINLGLPVLIPEEYVSDLELRLGLYRRIADLQTDEELEDIAVELIDRFGALPEEVKNLFEIMKIKNMCVSAGISKVDAGPKGIVISFHNDKFKNLDALIGYISRNPATVKIRGDQKLIIKHESDNIKDRLEGTKASLKTIQKLAA